MQPMGLLSEFCVVLGQLTPLVVMYADEHPEVQEKKVSSLPVLVFKLLRSAPVHGLHCYGSYLLLIGGGWKCDDLCRLATVTAPTLTVTSACNSASSMGGKNCAPCGRAVAVVRRMTS